MAELLNLINFDSINTGEETSLSIDLAAAQTKATVENSANFTTNDYFRIGTGEQAEIKKIQSVSGNEITVTSNFSFAHSKFEKVIKLRANQLGVYRASNIDGTTPADTSFSLILPYIDIDADQVYTLFYDATGGINYWYKYVYYNSTTATETDLADSIAIRGGQYGHYCSIDDAKKEAGLQENQYIDDTQVDVRRSQAEAEINTSLKAAGYTLPLQDSTGVAFTPAFIENIARILTAGYILVQEYGTQQGTATASDGQQKIKLGRELIAQILKDEVILMDLAFNQLSRKQRVYGYPDDSTATSGTSGLPEPRMFPMDKKY